MADAPAPAERRTPSLEEHPASLGVREQDVVVLGQEADRRGRVRIGPRRVGQVEELAAVLVAERPQPRPQALDDLAQPGQPAPGRHVRDRRRPERGEVPEDDVVERRPARERPAEPRLGGRRAVTCEVAPQTPRGGTWTSASLQRQARASAAGSRPGNRSASTARSSVPESGRSASVAAAYASTGARSTPSRAGAASRCRRSSASSTGCISGRSRRQSVGGDEVDRPAHDDDPHDGASDEAVGERLRSEAVDPRPERRVRVERHLRLEPDEVRDDVEDGRLGAREQVLAGQGRAAERPSGEDVAGHAAILAPRLASMGRSLDGRVAVVTGASSEIGATMADALAADGAAVVLAYHDTPGLAQDVVDRIVAEGGRALGVRADLSRVSENRRLVEHAVAELGRLDVFVANAGADALVALPRARGRRLGSGRRPQPQGLVRSARRRRRGR